MPLQRSYDVTCVEGGSSPAPAPPLSKGPWILRLIGFFIFCIVVLILCLCTWQSTLGPSSSSSNSSSPKNSSSLPKSETERLSGAHNFGADKGNISIDNTATTTELTMEKVKAVLSIDPATQPGSPNDSDGVTESAGTTKTQSSTEEPLRLPKSAQAPEATEIPESVDDPYSLDNSTTSTTLKSTNNEAIEPNVKRPSIQSRVGDPSDSDETTTVQTTREITSEHKTSTPFDETNTDRESDRTRKTDVKSIEVPTHTNTSFNETDLNGTTTVGMNNETTSEVTAAPLVSANNTTDPTTNTTQSTTVTTVGPTEPPPSTQGRQAALNETTTVGMNNETTSEVTAAPLVSANNTTDPTTDKTQSTTVTTVGPTEPPPSTQGRQAALNETTTVGMNNETTSEVTTAPLVSANNTTDPTTDKIQSTTVTTVGSTEPPPFTQGRQAAVNETTTVGMNNETTSEVTTAPLVSANNTTDPTTNTTQSTTVTTVGPIEPPRSTQGPETNTTEKNSTIRRALNSESPKPEDNPQLGSRVASRMLFYMNHSADACEDFYDYACGGFEAEELRPIDLARLATKRIFDEAIRDRDSGGSNEFLDYYNSCIAYNGNSNKAEKIELAKQAIAEVGSFYNEAQWEEEKFDLTDLLSKLLLRNSAPLFDITPDVAVDVQETCEDKKKPARFTLKLGPSLLENNYYEIRQEQKCYTELKSKTLERSVDLNKLHEEYRSCKNNPQSVEYFLESIRDVLRQLSHLVHDERQDTTFSVEELRRAFPWFYMKDTTNYKAKEEIRKVYVTKDYQAKRIEDLRDGLEDRSFLDWTRLLQTLGHSETELQQPLQVYFSDTIIKGLNVLIEAQSRTLHNAFLALYAHKIYYEFVEPPPDVENYCKRTATRLMAEHASSLYLRSFASEEHNNINATITGVFEGLKTELKSGLKAASWLNNGNDSEIMQKLRDLKIEIPDSSSHRDHSKPVLTGDFFKDTMMLEKENRKSMYGMMVKSPNDYEQTWTYFSRPYETTGSAIHGLNKIAMPYGAIDWPAVWSAEKLSAHHLVLATVGTRIATQISRHFDSTGIQYFASKSGSDRPAVLCSDEDDARDTYKTYIENQRTLDVVTRKIHLPATSQDVQYTINDLGVDERLAEITGLQLAYDTLSHQPPNHQTLLPWLTNQETNEKRQFFMAYAQMHCTNVPLTSNFISMYEEGNLPNQIRIFAAASSNEAMRNTWNCPKGSGGTADVIQPVFPHLQVDDRQQQTLL